MTSFFHDDITWCMEEDCPVYGCMRNPVNMIDHSGLHSYAMFKGTRDCPQFADDSGCLESCIHAKQCFSKHDDPNEAMRELIDVYCDNCMFSSMEED